MLTLCAKCKCYVPEADELSHRVTCEGTAPLRPEPLSYVETEAALRAIASRHFGPTEVSLTLRSHNVEECRREAWAATITFYRREGSILDDEPVARLSARGSSGDELLANLKRAPKIRLRGCAVVVNAEAPV